MQGDAVIIAARQRRSDDEAPLDAVAPLLSRLREQLEHTVTGTASICSDPGDLDDFSEEQLGTNDACDACPE